MGKRWLRNLSSESHLLNERAARVIFDHADTEKVFAFEFLESKELITLIRTLTSLKVVIYAKWLHNSYMFLMEYISIRAINMYWTVNLELQSLYIYIRVISLTVLLSSIAS